MPRLTIVIATFNSGKTIRNAMESVLAQDFQDWECIIVDGTSNDNTLSIVKEYVEKDSRFKYISEPDKGIYDAFNKGWKMANGIWVHYLGDDDKLTQEGMKCIFSTPNLCEYEVLSGHCYIEKIDGTIKANYSKGFFGCHQGKLTRKATLEYFNGFNEDYSIMADKDLMIRMEKAGVKVLNVNTFVAYFAMTGMSQSLSGLWRRTRELFIIYKKNQLSQPFLRSFKYLIGVIVSISYRKLRKFLKL